MRHFPVPLQEHNLDTLNKSLPLEEAGTQAHLPGSLSRAIII